MDIPSHFKVRLGHVLHVHVGIWEWSDHAETGTNTALTFGGSEYGLEMEYGAHGHLRLTRRSKSWTRELHWEETGRISRLWVDKGFGFIMDEQEAELFFIESSVIWAVFELLREGQRVQFNREESSKGPRAGMVRLVD